MPQTDPPAWDPASWMAQWTKLVPLAPQNLVQPILPLTFNVNAFNSGAPQTEAAVLQQFSYGRQLGRISELIELMLEAGTLDEKDERVVDFRKMRQAIQNLKGEGVAARIERLISDLDLLKKTNRPEYERLQAELRKRLPR